MTKLRLYRLFLPFYKQKISESTDVLMQWARDYTTLISRQRPQFNLQLPRRFPAEFHPVLLAGARADREPNYPTRDAFIPKEVSGVFAPRWKTWPGKFVSYTDELSRANFFKGSYDVITSAAELPCGSLACSSPRCRPGRYVSVS